MMFDIAFGIIFGFIGIVLLVAGFWIATMGSVFAYELYKKNKRLTWGLIGITALLIMVRLSV